ncbi:hypothetical protein XBKQ1_580042 [Xenorhabdus bovienii str. kraussei Quebec]|uniref:Uncharacterized protein n=2 Tax=Xenorhabdus bovienii TaxID=40576 RepID=A0A077PB31_XENBV|nr:hypothetical protein XBKQ1_580042 [Xenorhabdus bovienii str. kraussei Quebec]CDM88391.1 protein of unknown function [Xenorhabdus bovienii]
MKTPNMELNNSLLEKLFYILISRYYFTPYLYYTHFNYMEIVSDNPYYNMI